MFSVPDLHHMAGRQARGHLEFARMLGVISLFLWIFTMIEFTVMYPPMLAACKDRKEYLNKTMYWIICISHAVLAVAMTIFTADELEISRRLTSGRPEGEISELVFNFLIMNPLIVLTGNALFALMDNRVFCFKGSYLNMYYFSWVLLYDLVIGGYIVYIAAVGIIYLVFGLWVCIDF
jgi:hypothetical protein